MKRLLIIGCGDIARRVIPHVTARYRVYALIRKETQRAWLRSKGVTPILGDLADRRRLLRLAGLADVVLHFAPPPKEGAKDAHTRHLLAILSRGTSPAQLIYISTSGVYGDCSGARTAETHRLNPQSERSQRRVDAEMQIRHWAPRNGVRANILRVPGIYAQDRLPLERIRMSVPAIVAEEDNYTNHIHAEDLVRIIAASLRYGKPNRAYNASDDAGMKMGDYLDAVADSAHLRRPPRITRAKAQRILPDAMLSFMNESRRLDNGRMKKELNVRLRYPTVADLLGRSTAPSR